MKVLDILEKNNSLGVVVRQGSDIKVQDVKTGLIYDLKDYKEARLIGNIVTDMSLIEAVEFYEDKRRG